MTNAQLERRIRQGENQQAVHFEYKSKIPFAFELDSEVSYDITMSNNVTIS